MSNFINDEDKMRDFLTLTKDEFLASYSYLTEQDYNDTVTARLDYLRQEIEAERISQAELLELESLKDHIDPSDTLLLQWAGVKENNPPYKKPCDVMYHIFSNGADEYESDIDKVFSILETWYKDGNTDIRIYKQTEFDEDEGIFLDGDCIFSIGSWPM